MSIEFQPDGAGAFIADNQVGYGATLGDIGGFEKAFANAQERIDRAAAQAIQSGVESIFSTLKAVDAEAAGLSSLASEIEAGGLDLNPSDMVMMTVRSQEFLFHCQLTSNVANRTSDGIQQLFRQQG